MDIITTEQKIIQAANKLFAQKGYAATKTREIAEEAGTNLALLNYYFGSKENLFKKVLREKMEILLSNVMRPILSDETISLEDKIGTIIDNYTTLLLENEDLPIFILNELSVNKKLFEEITQNSRRIVQPVIEKQLKEKGVEISVTDLIINTLGMTMFPFIAKQLIISSGLLKEDEFTGFVTERKKKIRQWITAITQ